MLLAKTDFVPKLQVKLATKRASPLSLLAHRICRLVSLRFVAKGCDRIGVLGLSAGDLASSTLSTRGKLESRRPGASGQDRRDAHLRQREAARRLKGGTSRCRKR